MRRAAELWRALAPALRGSESNLARPALLLEPRQLAPFSTRAKAKAAGPADAGPKRPPSAYQVFYKSVLPAVKEKLGQGALVGAIQGAVAKQYKLLDAAEKKKLQEAATIARKAWDADCPPGRKVKGRASGYNLFVREAAARNAAKPKPAVGTAVMGSAVKEWRGLSDAAKEEWKQKAAAL